MANIISTLIAVSASILGGIIWFAIKYPDAYKKLYIPSKIFIIATIHLSYSLIRYYFGNNIYNKLIIHIPNNKKDIATKSVEDLLLQKDWLKFYAELWFISWVFFWIILWLSQHVYKTKIKIDGK